MTQIQLYLEKFTFKYCSKAILFFISSNAILEKKTYKSWKITPTDAASAAHDLFYIM